MLLSSRAKIIIAVLLLLFVVGGAGYYFSREFQTRSTIGSETHSSNQSVQQFSNQATTSAQSLKQLTPPNLSKPIVISVKLDELSQKNAREKIETITAQLKQNPTDFDAWIELGLYRKLIGDYLETEKIWQYTMSKWPGDSLPVSNLANLYIYELQDLKKAESYLLRAIEIEPSKTNNYYNAYEFYRYIIKDIPKARAVLERGLMASTEDKVGFRKLLDSF